MRPLKILTWHTHGSDLYYLTQVPHWFHVLSRPGRPAGYGGRCGHIPRGDNVIDLPVDQAAGMQFDCILFQDDDQYLKDQYAFLTPAQRRLPRLYIEHDTPREHPTDMRHPVDDPEVLLVHVTYFNALMRDSGRAPTRGVEHGVMVPPQARYDGSPARGLVIINHLARRGRRLGGDVFLHARDAVPLDLVGASTLCGSCATGMTPLPRSPSPGRTTAYRLTTAYRRCNDRVFQFPAGPRRRRAGSRDGAAHDQRRDRQQERRRERLLLSDRDEARQQTVHFLVRGSHPVRARGG